MAKILVIPVTKQEREHGGLVSLPLPGLKPMAWMEVDPSTGETVLVLQPGSGTAVRLPRGPSSERPANPVGGEARINTDGGSDTLEWWDEQTSAWVQSGAGDGGGGGGGNTYFPGGW